MTREVEARLKLSAIDRTQKAFAQVKRNLAEVERKAAAVNRAQATASRVARATEADLALAARAAGPAVLAYGVGASVNRFAEVERSVNRIGLTAGATADETKAAFRAISQSAYDYAMTNDEVAEGLNVLVSSGRDMKDALAFLPSVTATAQASGAAISDIANTADAVGRNFGIAGGQMQNAFDILVAGGKAGMFELRDMSAYLPSLAPAFSALGYEGEEGLKRMVTTLQVLRAGTGSAEQAASSAANIFAKIESEETVNRFKKMGVDLRTEMKKARAEGQDLLAFFVELTRKTVDGDLSRLPQLFSDMEYATGMRALLNNTAMFGEVMGKLGQSMGTVGKDLSVILNDSQAKIDRMSQSVDRLATSAGGWASTYVSPILESTARAFDTEANFAAGIAAEEAAGGSQREALREYTKQYREVYGHKWFDGWDLGGNFKRDMADFGAGKIASPFDNLKRERELRRGAWGKPMEAAYFSDLSAAPASRPLGSYGTGDKPAPYFRSDMEAASRNADRLAYNQGQALAADAMRKGLAAITDRSFGLSGLSAGPSGGPVPVVIQGINDAAARASAIPAAPAIYDTSFGDPMGGGIFGADPDALRNALDQGGQSVAQGGQDAGTAISGAVETLAAIAGDVRSAFATGAADIRSALSTPIKMRLDTFGQGQLASSVRGRTMPYAGTTKSGANGPAP